jgi:hypothetical protein
VNGSGIEIADPRTVVSSHPIKTVDQGDVLEFDVQEGEASLLVVSQKFHRDWHAQAFTPSGGWADVETVPVNGIFQGVFLPVEASKARLQFLPCVRHAWIAHCVWLLVAVVLGFRSLRSRSDRGSGQPGLVRDQNRRAYTTLSSPTS